MQYNVNALMGQPITDMDYAETFNIPKEYVETPKINEFMLTRQMNKEIEYYEKEGMTHTQAMQKAGENMRQSEAEINRLIKQRL